LRDHCAHARFIWNLAVEQHAHWHPGRKSAPGYLEQCRQLTAARAGHEWLRMGSQMVQQQALCRPSARQRSGRRHRPRGTQQRSPLDWRTNARSWSDEARTQAYAAPGAQARPCPARIEPPHAGKARRRQVARLRDGPAQGLDGEGQHGHRPQVRRDHGRGFADQKHDQIRQGHAREPGPERAAEGRPEPGHSYAPVGPAGPPSGAESSRPSGNGQPRVHEPTMLDMRAGGLEVAREPSRLPVHRLRICLQR